MANLTGIDLTALPAGYTVRPISVCCGRARYQLVFDNRVVYDTGVRGKHRAAHDLKRAMLELGGIRDGCQESKAEAEKGRRKEVADRAGATTPALT